MLSCNNLNAPIVYPVIRMVNKLRIVQSRSHNVTNTLLIRASRTDNVVYMNGGYQPIYSARISTGPPMIGPVRVEDTLHLLSFRRL